ncbi:hypothetical protein PMAYCL1PPCAC_28439, partial [Pristionchus mayeri]
PHSPNSSFRVFLSSASLLFYHSYLLMLVSPLLPLLFLFPHCISESLSHYTSQLVDDELISLNDDGTPFVLCNHMKGPRYSISKKCTTTSMSVPPACFTLWNGTGILAQSCYIKRDINDVMECSKKSCFSDRSPKNGIHFCCCHGRFCNDIHRLHTLESQGR